jgi:hypothetical protein
MSVDVVPAAGVKHVVPRCLRCSHRTLRVSRPMSPSRTTTSALTFGGTTGVHSASKSLSTPMRVVAPLVVLRDVTLGPRTRWDSKLGSDDRAPEIASSATMLLCGG